MTSSVQRVTYRIPFGATRAEDFLTAADAERFATITREDGAEVLSVREFPVTRRGLEMTPSGFGRDVLAGKHRVCPAG